MDAWIKVYHTLSDHPKVYALSDALKIEQFAAVGIVVCLWTWAVIHAPDGDLSRFPDAAVARACQWHKAPASLVKSLTECGFLDGDRRIHDWDEYAGALIESAQASKEKARQRVAAFRARNADVTRNSGVTQPQQNQPCNADVTRYTSVTKRSCNAAVTPRARVEEEEDIDIDNNTHLNIQQGESTRVRAREAVFDPSEPEDFDDGWRDSEKVRNAVAQRVIFWVRHLPGWRDGYVVTDGGIVGKDLHRAMTYAMSAGITPEACRELGAQEPTAWKWEARLKAAALENGADVPPEWRDQVEELREDLMEVGA